MANASDPEDGEDRPADGSGPFREPEPIEPETPRAENVLFVLLGVLATIALLATAVFPNLI
ncbi:hypothetical protein H5V44_05325 [Halobellus sp. MBLA0160]|uniref:DUF7312 domain-containing protein n=1 Tax=Halobellus ruber TaxID=2761102 RepID=A0A7J9SHW2_9EURY|nr:hypothetical protein [Halobellus ruber]